MHTDAQSNTQTLDRQNGYDFMGRPLWTSTTVGNTIVRQDFGYTPTGEVEYVRTRTNGQDYFQIDEYNVRGWLTRSRDGAFDERLAYEAPLHSAGAPRWGGDISEIEWKSGDSGYWGYAIISFSSWREAVNYMLDFYKKRVAWLDTHINALEAQRFNASTGQYEDL